MEEFWWVKPDDMSQIGLQDLMVGKTKKQCTQNNSIARRPDGRTPMVGKVHDMSTW
jgi:hypothetical protein